MVLGCVFVVSLLALRANGLTCEQPQLNDINLEGFLPMDIPSVFDTFNFPYNYAGEGVPSNWLSATVSDFQIILCDNLNDLKTRLDDNICQRGTYPGAHALGHGFYTVLNSVCSSRQYGTIQEFISGVQCVRRNKVRTTNPNYANSSYDYHYDNELRAYSSGYDYCSVYTEHLLSFYSKTSWKCGEAQARRLTMFMYDKNRDFLKELIADDYLGVYHDDCQLTLPPPIDTTKSSINNKTTTTPQRPGTSKAHTQKFIIAKREVPGGFRLPGNTSVSALPPPIHTKKSSTSNKTTTTTTTPQRPGTSKAQTQKSIIAKREVPSGFRLPGNTSVSALPPPIDTTKSSIKNKSTTTTTSQRPGTSQAHTQKSIIEKRSVRYATVATVKKDIIRRVNRTTR